MNFKTLLFLCCIITLLQTCNSGSASTNQLNDSAAKEKSIVPQISDPGGLPSHEIGNVSAKDYMSRYQAYIDGMNHTVSKNNATEYPDAGKKLIYGAKVDRLELFEILQDSDSGDDLYIMMGIMPTDSTEMIFALNSSSAQEWLYFDFTQPCPTACP